jgi:hypothetical protein
MAVSPEYIPVLSQFLGNFSRFSQNCEKRLSTSSFLCVLLSVRPHGITRVPLDGFLWILIFEDLFFPPKIRRKIYVLKSDNNNGYFALTRVLCTETGTLHGHTRLLYTDTATLRGHGYFTRTRVLYADTATSRGHGYFTRTRLLHADTATSRGHGYFARTRLLYTDTATSHGHGYFTRTPLYIYDNIFLNSSQKEKYFSQKL